MDKTVTLLCFENESWLYFEMLTCDVVFYYFFLSVWSLPWSFLRKNLFIIFFQNCKVPRPNKNIYITPRINTFGRYTSRQDLRIFSRRQNSHQPGDNSAPLAPYLCGTGSPKSTGAISHEKCTGPEAKTSTRGFHISGKVMRRIKKMNTWPRRGPKWV